MKSINFIPSPLRPWAIAQLCLAFTLLTALFISPFTEETMHQKKASLLYQALHEHYLWNSLSTNLKNEIERKHDKMIAQRKSFSDKVKDGIEILALKAPFFLRIWILTSIVVSVAILLKVEGALYLLWIIPALALFYGIETTNFKNHETILVPKESDLINRYLEGELPSSIYDQQMALQKAWESYLIDSWAPENIKTLDAAQFFFKKDNFLNLPQNHVYQAQPQPFILLTLFLFWNLLFVGGVVWKNFKFKTD